MRTIALAIAFLLALTAAAAAQEVHTGGNIGGVPLPGTSGGVVCYTSTATLASSNALTASAVVVGGGAGVCPSTVDLVTVSTYPILAMTGQNTQSPQITMQGQANDTTGGQFNLQKLRNNGGTLSVQSGDQISTFYGMPYTNGGFQTSALFGVSVSGAPSGSNVPTKWTWQTSTAAAPLANTMTFDETGTLTAPALFGRAQAINVPVTVNFANANTDTAIPILLPTGFTQFRANSAYISQCSASITAATFGIFTTTGGGGTAIVSAGQVPTVANNTANTANNYQFVTAINNANTTAYTPVSSAIQFRVGTAASATCKVVFVYQFVP